MPARDERREDRGTPAKWRAITCESGQRKATPAELLSTRSVQRVDEPDGEQQRREIPWCELAQSPHAGSAHDRDSGQGERDGDEAIEVPAPAARAAQDLSSKGSQAPAGRFSIRDRGHGEGREERAERKEHPKGSAHRRGRRRGRRTGEGMTLDERSHCVLQVRGTTATDPYSAPSIARCYGCYPLGWSRIVPLVQAPGLALRRLSAWHDHPASPEAPPSAMPRPRAG